MIWQIGYFWASQMFCQTEAGCVVKGKLEILFSWRWDNIEHAFTLNETKSNRRWNIHETGERGEIFMNIPIFSQEKGGVTAGAKDLSGREEMGIRKRAEASHQCLLPCNRRVEGKTGLKSNTQTWVGVNECRSQIEDERGWLGLWEAGEKMCFYRI